MYKSFPVWSGKASRTGGKDYPVSNGINFPMERNMQEGRVAISSNKNAAIDSVSQEVEALKTYKGNTKF